VIDKIYLNDGATAGHVTMHYHYFKHDGCPDDLWMACLYLKEILDRELTYLAPSPPF